LHLYGTYNPPVPNNEIPKIEVTLKMCTLYKGKPNRLAHIKYSNPTDGKLDKGPFTYIDGNGWKGSITYMLEGSPGDSYYRSYFNSDGTKRNVDSLVKETDVSGWQ
jgi:hypothetical protein